MAPFSCSPSPHRLAYSKVARIFVRVVRVVRVCVLRETHKMREQHPLFFVHLTPIVLSFRVLWVNADSNMSLVLLTFRYVCTASVVIVSIFFSFPSFWFSFCSHISVVAFVISISMSRLKSLSRISHASVPQRMHLLYLILFPFPFLLFPLLFLRSPRGVFYLFPIRLIASPASGTSMLVHQFQKQKKHANNLPMTCHKKTRNLRACARTSCSVPWRLAVLSLLYLFPCWETC